MAPSKKRTAPASRKGGFVLGRARFEKICEVEGIKTSEEMRRMFEEFDRRGLSNAERRAAILEMHTRGDDLRRRWDSGKASGLAGELDAATLIAEEKVRKTRQP